MERRIGGDFNAPFFIWLRVPSESGTLFITIESSVTLHLRERLQAAMVRKIPNLLTTLRLVLIPLFVALMVNPSTWMLRTAAFVFALAAITDFVDGFVARRYQVVSNFGKLFDPLADKLLVMAGLVMLLAQRSEIDNQSWIPGWMVVLILAREIWITGLRGMAAADGNVVAASSTGKIKSGFQMVAIFLLLFHGVQFPWSSMDLTCDYVGLHLLLISLLFSYWGAVDYTFQLLLCNKHKL